MGGGARIIFFALGVVVFQSACGTGRNRGCEKQINDKIRPGMPLAIAEADLKKCGFNTTIDPVKKTLYGDKVVAGTVVSERTQVVVNLDSDNRVVTVTVTKGLIAP